MDSTNGYCMIRLWNEESACTRWCGVSSTFAHRELDVQGLALAVAAKPPILTTKPLASPVLLAKRPRFTLNPLEHHDIHGILARKVPETSRRPSPRWLSGHLCRSHR